MGGRKNKKHCWGETTTGGFMVKESDKRHRLVDGGRGLERPKFAKKGGGNHCTCTPNKTQKKKTTQVCKNALEKGKGPMLWGLVGG